MLRCSKIRPVEPPRTRWVFEEADMNADSRSSGRNVQVLVEEPVSACTKCPVCGSEECLMLEELGSYCATKTAASLANREDDRKSR